MRKRKGKKILITNKSDRRFISPSTYIENPLIQLINTMRSVQIGNPDSKLNEVSISDNNGGRILL